MQADIKAAAGAANATTAVTSARVRLKGLTVSHASSATVSVTSGTATVWAFTAPAAAGTVHILLPGEGILCPDGLSVVCAANTTAEVYYG